jgi:hypothetical protein
MARTVPAAKPNCRATWRRRRFASHPHRILKILAERCLTRQLRYRFDLQSAFRTANPVVFHHYEGLILAPRQIPHCALPDLLDPGATAVTTGTNQHLVPALPPYPQLQRPRLLIDLVPVHAVPRPIQNLDEFSFRQPREFSSLVHIPAQRRFYQGKSNSYSDSLPIRSRRPEKRSVSFLQTD